ERIIVVAIGLWEEAVIGRVMHGAEEHAVDTQQAGLLVKLVFDLRADGNFDNAVEDFRGLVAKLHVVPGVHKITFRTGAYVSASASIVTILGREAASSRLQSRRSSLS